VAKEKYRLEPVLHMREKARDEAQQAVTDRKKELDFELKKLEKLKEMRKQVDVKKELCTQKFYEIMLKPGIDISTESFRHDKFQEVLDKEAAACDQAILQQQQQIRQAEERVEEAKQAMLKATVDLQAMEKHKEGWQKQIKVEELRKEQEVQEELGEAMWLQNRRRASSQE